jgi:hypothetical protein
VGFRFPDATQPCPITDALIGCRLASTDYLTPQNLFLPNTASVSFTLHVHHHTPDPSTEGLYYEGVHTRPGDYEQTAGAAGAGNDHA